MKINLQAPLETIQNMINSILATLPNIFLAIMVFSCFFLLARYLKEFTIQFFFRFLEHQNLAAVFSRCTQSSVIFIGFFLASTIVFPSIRANSLLQLLGFSSVAIGFAFRDILENFLAGILILLTGPFKVHDEIKVNNFEGRVEEIQTRATFLITQDGRRIVIPNSQLFTQAVIVHTAFPSVRCECTLAFAPNEDLKKVKSLIIHTLQNLREVLDEPAVEVQISELTTTLVQVKVRWWSRSSSQEISESQDRVLAALQEITALRLFQGKT